MFFEDEPAHIKAARNVPLHSTWESRQPVFRRAPAETLPARTDRVFKESIREANVIG